MLRRSVCSLCSPPPPLCNVARGLSKILMAFAPDVFTSSDARYGGGAAQEEQTGSNDGSGLHMPPLPQDVVEHFSQSGANNSDKGNQQLRYRAVPATRVGRAMGFTTLFTQLAADKLLHGNSTSGGLSEGSHTMIVDTLCRMRGSVLKLGQMLSIQDSSTVPPAVTKIFERVRDQAFAMPAGQLHATLEKEFRKTQQYAGLASDHQETVKHNSFDWRTELFTEWCDTPIAAASIGQVHYAVLRGMHTTSTSTSAKQNGVDGSGTENTEKKNSCDGDDMEVAVKVQYPGVAASIDADVANLRMLMTLNVLPPGMFVDKILAELKAELSLECKYTLEGAKQNAYKALVERDDTLKDVFFVPRALEHLSTDQVLISEYVRGIPIDKLAVDINNTGSNSSSGGDGPHVPQAFRNFVAEKMLRLTLTELFLWRFMQTDPNFANFLFDANHNRINLLDFGAARAYDVAFVNDYLDVVAAAANEDRDVIVRKSIALGFLTGREVKEMIDAHVSSVIELGKPFRRRTAKGGGPDCFDFSSENIPSQIAQYVPTMVKLRLVPPPTPVYSLHRRLSGTILLATKLNARIPSADIFWEIHDKARERMQQVSES